jgi:sulfatase maturation enzyme AslB (radical SAM superfamily)
MKATNLTISIPAECNLKCPYCISKMTFAPASDPAIFERNLIEAKYLAKAAQVSNVLITSKGEPLLNKPDIELISNMFREFPLEIQTNGKLLDTETINWLYNLHFNVVAISINGDFSSYTKTFRWLWEYTLPTRATIVLTDKTKTADIIDNCLRFHISQLTIRRATKPSNIQGLGSTDVANWIEENTHKSHKEFLSSLEKYNTKKNLIRTLPWGSKVFNVEGIAVTIIDYCIQENHNEDNIRSLIYNQDGHMYTSWDKQSSILF